MVEDMMKSNLILRQDKNKLKHKILCVCVYVFGPPPSQIQSVLMHYTVTRAPQRWECRLNHKDQFFFLLMLVRMVMVTCWWLWTCLLCILSELYAKYQYVILCELSFKIYIYMAVPSTFNRWNSSQSFLRIYFWGYNPQFGSNKIRFYFSFVAVV